VSRTDLLRFRRLCRDFRRLAIFMVASVGLLLAFIHVIAPTILWLRGDLPDRDFPIAPPAVLALPAIFYLYGVWSIGSALGRLAEGRLIQPILATALRQVGLALGIGGVASVFVVVNILRLLGDGKGGYLHFDVPGMTLGMIGGALFLLGRVADQAGVIQAELDEMV
jgi:hypothetical protein